MKFISWAIAFVLFPCYIPAYVVGSIWAWLKHGWKNGKNFNFLGDND